MSAITVSLCVSTYNSPQALRLCLESVLLQTKMPDEILIGDDGSTAETKNLIESYKVRFNVPLIHVWQPDEGYRLAAARNNCFRIASGSYIIQIDGDLILEKRFIQDHVRFAQPNTFLCGSRSFITEQATAHLYQQNVLNWDFMKRRLIKSHNAFRFFPLAAIVYFFQRGLKQTRYVVGANMSFWKKDIMLVNGYNEDFTGWGKEDNDLAVRLFYAGVKIRFLKHAGIAYHLHHNDVSTSNLESNEQLLKNAEALKRFFVENGIKKVTNLQ